MQQKIPAIILTLARLYDHHKQELTNAVSGAQIPLSDPRMKDKLIFLREIASTLSVVYQVEKLRSKDPSPDMKLPDEQLNTKDPVLEAAMKKKFQPTQFGQNMNPNQGLDPNNFPGGWQP